MWRDSLKQEYTVDIKDLAGKIIKTSIGCLKIKEAKYSGLGAGKKMEVIKHVSVKTECGSEFTSTMQDLTKSIQTAAI